MGTSNDAILVYGFAIELYSDDEERCSELFDGNDGGEKREQFERKHKVDIVVHCSEDNPMYILTVSSSYHVVAARGYPEKVQPAKLAALDRVKADAVLAKAATALGITPKTGAWLLCSYTDGGD
jgi:hypothetical protein